MLMKTSLKGMLILSVYYILVLPIKFLCIIVLAIHCVYRVLDMQFHMDGTVLNNIERTLYSTNDIILWGQSSIDLVTQ